MSLFDLQDVCIAIGSLATLDLPMVVDLIGIYVLKGPYCTLTTTNWFLQALSVIHRGSWDDVARRFTMIRWAMLVWGSNHKRLQLTLNPSLHHNRSPPPSPTRRRSAAALRRPVTPPCATIYVIGLVSITATRIFHPCQNPSDLLVQIDRGILIPLGYERDGYSDLMGELLFHLPVGVAADQNPAPGAQRKNAPGSCQFHEGIGTSTVDRLDRRLIRSTTRISTRSSILLGSHTPNIPPTILNTLSTISVREWETSTCVTLNGSGITDSACKNQSVMVSVYYGPFTSNIPIKSTTIDHAEPLGSLGFNDSAETRFELALESDSRTCVLALGYDGARI
ncbi:hypothetical protein F511_08681 [Dorcoceras hygrometricum]|uniref:Uncharacterized protein n=1 Tax=Dorcoceras hygrometricum TaxID=472368 RepID=A0A2Z7CH28_9LAMI|nr:hypothetical protein F511_08681 [Dorcoceras hygrometricum]